MNDMFQGKSNKMVHSLSDDECFSQCVCIQMVRYLIVSLESISCYERQTILDYDAVHDFTKMGHHNETHCC